MTVKKKKVKKTVVTAKKKEAIARAVIRPGKGIIRINGKLLDLTENQLRNTMLREPLMIAGPLAKEVNITINVHGGGVMGQTVAVRGAIAKSLVAYSKDDNIRKAFYEYDRLMLVDDPRRVEPKKPLGTKARAKKQKSKR